MQVTKFFFIIFIMLSPLLLQAQQADMKSVKLRFQSMAAVSLLAGESNPSYQWQIVNGVSIKNWFTGIGAGLDHYRFRSVPVFVSVQRHRIFNSPLFTYADGGAAIPFVPGKDDNLFWADVKYSTGFYSEAGIGYRLSLKRKLGLQFSAGYSFRTMKEKVTHFSPWSSAWPQPRTESTNYHRFHLLTLRAAVNISGK